MENEFEQLLEASKNIQDIKYSYTDGEDDISEVNQDTLVLYPEVIGSPYGSMEEKINFLKWIMETKHINKVSSFFRTAINNFGNPVTMEFLKNIGGDKRRISELRYRSGFKTLPISYYFKEMVNTKFKSAFTNYSLNNGKIGIIENKCSVGRFAMRRRCRTFHRFITNKEFNELNKRLKDISDRVKKETEEKEYKMEITLNNLFNLSEGKEWASVHPIYMTDKQYEASRKLQEGQGKMFRTKCEYCSGRIQFPLSENIENDKWEELAHSLYTMFLNEKEGIVLCKKCLENIWIEEKILELFSGLNKEKNYKFPIDEFCKEFRKDKLVVDGEVTGKEILRLMKSININREVMSDGINIII